jgi:hypothetical protein
MLFDGVDTKMQMGGAMPDPLAVTSELLARFETIPFVAMGCLSAVCLLGVATFRFMGEAVEAYYGFLEKCRESRRKYNGSGRDC